MSENVVMRWNEDAGIADAAAFAAEVIGAAPEYISHGEIQTGLSDDGESWVPGLAGLFASDFANRGDRDLLVVRHGADVVGLLVVAFETGERRTFAVIEDMAVAPALRSQGLGSRILREAMDRIKARSVEWVFLESGLRNHEAHAFFEREGFTMTSHVFARRIA